MGALLQRNVIKERVALPRLTDQLHAYGRPCTTTGTRASGNVSRPTAGHGAAWIRTRTKDVAVASLSVDGLGHVARMGADCAAKLFKAFSVLLVVNARAIDRCLLLTLAARHPTPFSERRGGGVRPRHVLWLQGFPST